MSRKNKRKWNFDKILESGKKYNHIFDWETNDVQAYRAAKRYGHFKEATAHMTKKIRKVFTIKYSDADILKVALKFNTPKDWYTESPSTYSIAHQRKLIDKATAHMDRQLEKAGFYTKEKLRQSALKYRSTFEWIKNEPKFYAAAWRQGLIKKTTVHFKNHKPITEKVIKIKTITSHFKRQSTKLKYTKEEVISAAKKFNTRKEWKDQSLTTYNFAYGRPSTPLLYSKGACLAKGREARLGCVSGYAAMRVGDVAGLEPSFRAVGFADLGTTRSSTGCRRDSHSPFYLLGPIPRHFSLQRWPGLTRVGEGCWLLRHRLRGDLFSRRYQRGPPLHWLNATDGVVLGHWRFTLASAQLAGRALVREHCGESEGWRCHLRRG